MNTIKKEATKRRVTPHRKYFGTDGIRGKVGEEPITPDFILKLGWATGRVFAGQGANRVIIGKDTRISGYMFESALESGLSASGIDVWLLGPMPTPATAYLTRTFNASAGIMITASHNPHYDNGFKFFSNAGIKIHDNFEAKIEKQLEEPLQVVQSSKLGKAFRVDDASGRYIEYCKATAPGLNLSGITIVVDAAHGANYHVGPVVFQELGATVIPIGTSPNGFNINCDVGSTAIDHLANTVICKKADLGIAFDGDGDRLIMVDHKGQRVDGDLILYIIAQHMIQQGTLKSGVVGTLMTNLGVEHAIKDLGIPFYRAAVGDRYVNEALLQKKWQLGGEASGHIICRNVSTTGDGIVASLQVLKALSVSSHTLHDLISKINKYPQQMVNIPVKNAADLLENTMVIKVIKASQEKLKNNGRVVVRPSGTEPVIRVMVEGINATEVNQYCAEILNAIESINR